jgi:hypothetical protein
MAEMSTLVCGNSAYTTEAIKLLLIYGPLLNLVRFQLS